MAHHLNRLVALAGQNQQIPRLTMIQGPADGLPAVHNDPVGCRAALEAPEHLLEDDLGALVPRVVGGKDQVVRPLGCLAGHHRTLPPVPVAPAAKEQLHPLGVGGAHRIQQLFDPIRGVGIVPQHGKIPAVEALHAPRNPWKPAQRPDHLLQGNPQSVQATHGHQGIADRKFSQHGKGDRQAAPSVAEEEVGPVLLPVQIPDKEIRRLIRQGDRAHRDLHLATEAPAIGIVEVYYSTTAHRKQLLFGRKVRLHPLVIIQMILG